MSGLRQYRPPLWAVILTGLLIAAFLYALSVGPVAITFADLLALVGGQAADPTHSAVLLKIRLPRSLLAALVGAALGTSGGAFQANNAKGGSCVIEAPMRVSSGVVEAPTRASPGHGTACALGIYVL